MKNLGQLMKQAQQMQQKMAEMQAELEAVEMTGVAGGGMVQMTLNGKGDLKRLKIDKNVVDPGRDRGAGGSDRRRLQRCPGKGQRPCRNRNAEADRRPSPPGGMKLPF
jgi:hypothetical protein